MNIFMSAQQGFPLVYSCEAALRYGERKYSNGWIFLCFASKTK